MALFYMLSANCYAQAPWEVDLVRSINTRDKNNIPKLISAAAEPLAVAIPVGMFAASLITHNKKDRDHAYEMAASIAIAAATTITLKTIVKRERPYDVYPDIYPDKIDAGYSFPSAHTSVAFSTATSLALIYKKWYITIPCYAWAAGVGYSRMYLGQHYPSDVLVGALLGTGSGFAAHWLNKKLLTPRKKKAAAF